MESVGEFFRQVRETKGLTVDEVSSKTRIRSDFVKALEDGNFSKLPDQVFARGFVRSYARSLGLDEEDAIQRFTKSAGAFYDKQDERERLKIRQFEEERKRQANRKAVSVAIGIAVLVLIFLLSREQSSVLRVEESDQIYAKQNIERNIAVAKDELAAASSGEPEQAAEAPKQSEVQAASANQVSTEDARRPEPIPPPIAAPKPESPTVSAVSSPPAPPATSTIRTSRSSSVPAPAFATWTTTSAVAPMISTGDGISIVRPIDPSRATRPARIFVPPRSTPITRSSYIARLR